MWAYPPLVVFALLVAALAAVALITLGVTLCRGAARSRREGRLSNPSSSD